MGPPQTPPPPGVGVGGVGSWSGVIVFGRSRSPYSRLNPPHNSASEIEKCRNAIEDMNGKAK